MQAWPYNEMRQQASSIAFDSGCVVTHKVFGRKRAERKISLHDKGSKQGEENCNCGDSKEACGVDVYDIEK